MKDGIRIFTVEEANSLLPRIKGMLDALRDGKREIMSLQAKVDIIEITSGLNERTAAPIEDYLRQVEERITEFRGIMQQLDGLGCELKDLDKGFLDFYTRRNNQIVYLCWMDGEETISHWHGLEAAYRQKI